MLSALPRIASSRTGLPRIDLPRCTLARAAVAAQAEAPRVLIKFVETFLVSQNWTVPYGVTSIDKTVGRGAPGEPAWPAGDYWVIYSVEDIDYVGPEYGEDSYSRTINRLEYADPGPNPQNLQSQYQPAQHRQVSTYEESEYGYDPGSPATSGAPSTGFGQTFPGGYGGTAYPVTNEVDVAVTAGQIIALTIPAEGFIEITYYK
jgi:hypothetical protein